MALSFDGKTLATHLDDNLVLWDVVSGEERTKQKQSAAYFISRQKDPRPGTA